jgi:hypothetical protein
MYAERVLFIDGAWRRIPSGTGRGGRSERLAGRVDTKLKQVALP